MKTGASMNTFMKRAKKRLLLYFAYLKINIKEVEIYSWDFLFGIIAMFINYAAELFSLYLIFELVPEINGWNREQILLMYGIGVTGFSLWSCIFINTITLPYYLKRGEFDRFLVRPIQPITQIMLDGFDEDAGGDLIIGIIVLGIAGYRLNIGLFYIPCIIVTVISGCFVYAGLSILLSTISFFTISQADVANLTMEIKEIAKYPLTIYPRIMQVFFTFLIPIAFVSFIPSKMILEREKVYLFFMIPVIALIFYTISKKIWNLGVRHYESTGS